MMLVIVVFCTACVDPFWAANLEKEFREGKGMKIGEIESDSYHPNGGFWIMLQPELAKKLRAPDSDEFKRFLNDRVQQDEMVSGRKYCQFGYELSPMYWYHGIYAELSGICLSVKQ